MKYTNRRTGEFIEALYCGHKTTAEIKNWLAKQGVTLTKKEGFEPYYYTWSNSDMTLSQTAMFINNYPIALSEVYIYVEGDTVQFSRVAQFRHTYKIQSLQYEEEGLIVQLLETGVMITDYNGEITYLPSAFPDQLWLDLSAKIPENGKLYDILVDNVDCFNFNVQTKDPVCIQTLNEISRLTSEWEVYDIKRN